VLEAVVWDVAVPEVAELLVTVPEVAELRVTVPEVADVLVAVPEVAVPVDSVVLCGVVVLVSRQTGCSGSLKPVEASMVAGHMPSSLVRRLLSPPVPPGRW
jgi:hypothetical protein